jgi:starch synthase
MRVLFVTSEAVPFAKTGGLADVAGAIPKCLRQGGQDVAIALPYYREVRQQFADAVEDTGLRLTVPVGTKRPEARILKGQHPEADVPVYFVQNASYFDRQGLYGTAQGDHRDNCERFVFFCRAVLDSLEALGGAPDLVHCNDWQTALIPVYLKTLYADRPQGQAGCLLTLHNLAYQGLFPKAQFPLTGLPAKLFTMQGLEFYGEVNLLKGGLLYADALNTVSPTYAKEIQDPDLGCGLDGVLRERGEELYGILNGVDYTVWDPATDPLIEANYAPDDLRGKAICKRALQAECGLPIEDVPLLGIISRLADQKGLDILAKAMDRLMALDVQLVLLGTGEARYHALFQRLARQYPSKFSAHLTFDNPLAHRIEAGADMFLMPSRYEPCGLNQLYSLKYGAVPVVRKTGGLADTITNCTPSSLGKGTANGFSFRSVAPKALVAAVGRALKLFPHQRRWERLMRTGMLQDWSWSRSAAQYLELYQEILRAGGLDRPAPDPARPTP